MSLRGTARLLRLPLVTTAVADAAAGYLVALLPNRLGLLVGTSAGLYLFGMVENDLADRRRDRDLGADRPLATGEVSVAWAAGLLVLTAVAAGACAVALRGGALVLAIGTFAAVNFYNLAAKRGPSWVAMTSMGLCRLLNYLFGVAVAVSLPRHITADLFGLGGPLWVRHAMAVFFATFVVTGYSIAARHGITVSTRPWRHAFYVSAVAGFAMIAISVNEPTGAFEAPVARVFAAMLLASLWPGGLWSAAGPERKPEQYSRFIHRMLYWMIVMDAAFAADAWLMGR